MKYNFNGFTTKANEALNQAISSAEQLGHTYVGSEHLLLGLLKIGTGVAAAVLNKNGITAENIEELIRANIGCGTVTRLSPITLRRAQSGLLKPPWQAARTWVKSMWEPSTCS